jgi:hypothetical protein
VEYHLSIGVQYFVIYDNNSIFPIRETLVEYIKKGVVYVIDCPIKSRPQLRAYNHCLFYMCEKTKWIIYIDVDEFIILNKHNQIGDLLKEYDSFGGLSLNWKLYNAGGHITKPKESVMEAYKEYLPLSYAVNKHVKTILQPRYTLTIGNSHQAMYIDGYYAVNENYKHVAYAFSDFSNEVAHINHYYTKSYEEWLYKVEKGRVDFDKKRKEQEFWDLNPQMLLQQNEIRAKLGDVAESFTQPRIELSDQSRFNWLPLFVDIDKQKVETCLKQIELTLLKCDIKALGLFNGQSQCSLFFFHLGKVTGSPLYEDKGYEFLDSVILNIRNLVSDHSFTTGLCGIGWLVEHLAQNQFIENNTNEILSDLDILFKDSIFNLLDYSLTNGLVGYGMYFLSRLANPENFNIQQKQLLVQIVNYLECFLPDNFMDANEPENLTILQGYLAVIPFLCQVYRININNYKVRCVLNKYVKFIFSYEEKRQTNLCFPNQTQDGTFLLQWNCGDLAVASSLLQASLVIKNKEWEKKAFEIIMRTISENEIASPNISILYGTAGIAHMYNRFYQHYLTPELRKASIHWLNKTMDILENKKEGIVDFELIDGLAGTGLVLMSTISEIEPSWDSAFLMAVN